MFVYDLDWKCSQHGENAMKSQKKKEGLFGEALFLTTSHFEVLVIDNKSIILCSPPFVNPGSTSGSCSFSSAK